MSKYWGIAPSLIILLQGVFYSLLTFFMKRENPELILAVKIIEWRKFIDYFGLSIESNQSRVGKKNLYIFHIEYIPIPASGNPHVKRKQLDK